MLRVFALLIAAFSVSAVLEAAEPADAGRALPAGVPILCLHPTFRLTAEDVAAAIKSGEEAARKGKKLDDLVSAYKQMPRWVRGKSGRVHESAIWCRSLGGLPISEEAYRAACNYTALILPDNAKTDGVVVNSLQFEVLLTSAPRVAQYRWQKDRQADEDDVTVRKFVLSDDKGNNFEGEEGSTSASDSSGTTTFSGVSVVPHTERTTSNANISGSVYGSGGYASGNANIRGTSTTTRYEYIPWSEDHPYYQARYNVRFSLMDKDGRPRIVQDVKEITLRIITPNGEQDVVYKLPKITQPANVPKQFGSEDEKKAFWIDLLRKRYGVEVMYAATAEDLIALEGSLRGGGKKR